MMRQESAKRANRDGLLFSLMFIELDGFKQVNDTLGHDKGDMLLAEAARRISKCVREADTVARLGGDEFTIFLPEVAGRADKESLRVSSASWATHSSWKKKPLSFRPVSGSCFISGRRRGCGWSGQASGSGDVQG